MQGKLTKEEFTAVAPKGLDELRTRMWGPPKEGLFSRLMGRLGFSGAVMPKRKSDKKAVEG
jgi:hypothetical protein